MIEITAGKTVNLNVTVRDAAGAIVSIAGAAPIKWQLKQRAGDAPKIAKTLGAGITITDGPGGKFTIAIQPSDSVGLKGEFYSIAEVTNAAGEVTDVFCDQIKIKPNFIT